MLQLRTVADQDLPGRRAQVVERVALGRSAARYLEVDLARQQVGQQFTDSGDRAHLLEVTDGDAGDGQVVGVVWAVEEAEELAVYDAHLDDPGRVAELVPPLLDVAGEHGCRMLGVGSRPHDPTMQALVEVPGATPRAFNMMLDLARPIADPAGLELRPMSAEEFDTFLGHLVGDYAATLAQSGMSPEKAAERSARQTAELIPSGTDSPGMEFFSGWVGEESVGRLWLEVDQPMAFVYDVEVVESQRRKGYGAAIMNAAALWSRDHGHPVLGLNVFAHNPGAKALYDKLGYQVMVDYRTFDVPRV